jgi:hypothetical protein
MTTTVADIEPRATVDYLGKNGAERLARRIQGYWHGLGYNEVKVWIEPEGRAYGVRSNLRAALPPTM